jgi:pimeloyl-ACP methyl ester carboxylesterase
MPYVEVNGVRLYVQITGTGTPIIFIHPPLLTSVNFTYQQQELAEQFQVITFDLRGHGRSDVGREPFTYSLIVQDMVALLDQLQIKQAFIAGYSTGGAIALEALLTYPDRFLGGIMISTMSEVTSYYLKNLVRLAVAMANRLTLSLLAVSIAKGNADCLDTYQKLYKDAILGDHNRIQEYYQYSLTYRCSIDRLASIDHPMLLLYGDQDSRFRKNANILRNHLRDNNCYWIKGLTHQLPTKAAKKVNEQIAQFIIHQA